MIRTIDAWDVRTQSQLPAPPETGRLRFAHGGWAGDSIFEEAFTLGQHAGAA